MNPAGKVLGFLSEINLVKILGQFYQSKTKTEIIANYLDFLVSAETIHKDDQLPVVMKAMFQSQTNRLIVCDGAGKLMGIVSPMDLLRMFDGMAKARANVSNEENKT